MLVELISCTFIALVIVCFVLFLLFLWSLPRELELTHVAKAAINIEHFSPPHYPDFQVI